VSHFPSKRASVIRLLAIHDELGDIRVAQRFPVLQRSQWTVRFAAHVVDGYVHAAANLKAQPYTITNISSGEVDCNV